MSALELSVIVPVTGRYDDVDALYRAYRDAIAALGKSAEIIYVLDGAATFVTGGRPVDSKLVATNEFRGSMIDGGEKDEKVLAVPAGDPRFNDIQSLADVNKHTLKEIAHFFETYKKIQNKEVSVGEWQGKEEAEAAFARAWALYEEKKAA